MVSEDIGRPRPHSHVISAVFFIYLFHFECGLEQCRAITAAIFGTYEGKLDFVPVAGFDRFQNLVDGEYDVLIRTTTHTMERQVFEPTTGQRFAFSVPYLYNGLKFGGLPDYVACTDNFTISEDICADLKVCVLDGTTHVDIIAEKFPDADVIAAVTSESLYSNFQSGSCNVIAGEQFDIADSILRDRGYTGDYDYGILTHSKEPLCMVTRSDDVEWSDFVNWVLQALLTAEEEGIIQQIADLIEPTDAFGEGSQFALAFRNAVSAVGNYAEIYQRTLESIMPRPTVDKINKGDTGLIYSLPFGNLNAVGSNPASGSTLAIIKARGFLRCGISTRVIFANLDEATGSWDGTYSTLQAIRYADIAVLHVIMMQHRL
jgi:general L-amino acid transport system substrate-binding protein